jgi:dephospho-CoA kinase
MTGRTCLVGLTGGLASGKSTVAVMLGRRGVPIFDADAAVHRLYRAGNIGARAVASAFGSDVLAEDGAVDRSALARRVVGDDDALERLNDLIHPLVRTEITRWLDALDPRPPVAVVEAALLVETGSYRDYDALVVVRCEPDQQLQRAMARGMDQDRAHGLLSAQLDLEAKVAVADVVIDNSGSFDELAAGVDAAWAEIVELCGSRD